MHVCGLFKLGISQSTQSIYANRSRETVIIKHRTSVLTTKKTHIITLQGGNLWCVVLSVKFRGLRMKTY